MERVGGAESGVGVAVGSGVAVGINAARVCSTEIWTHICVASIPISGVGAACGFGAQADIKKRNAMILKYFRFTMSPSPSAKLLF